jgi:hypothetical protein
MRIMDQIRSVALILATGATIALAGPAKMQDYAKPGELDPLPENVASVYRTPWRSNLRTVSAYDALQGAGVYWKHIPLSWTGKDQIHVMQEMAKAGVSRARLAPHFTMYIHKDWTAPMPEEVETLRKELRACKAAGIRPVIVFVHIAPVGKPNTDELQRWWRFGTNENGETFERTWTTELLPVGEIGSDKWNRWVDMTYTCLKIILDEAKAAGFTERASFDLEMGQNLWWGAPAVPEPMPAGLEVLDPGGVIYEFDKVLMEKARRDGYQEVTFWWGEAHHKFERTSEKNLPSDAAGYAVSIYGAWSGNLAGTWLKANLFNGGPNDLWPVSGPMSFAEGEAPSMTLARPESWMADFSRHDNLVDLIKRMDRPVAITSLGTVPADIPEWQAGGLSGWQIKSRGLTRSLAFWLNQGAKFVLLHSAFEAGQPDAGETVHSLIAETEDITSFELEDSQPLATLASFTSALAGAEKLDKITPLNFRFTLANDFILIPASKGSDKVLRASDAVTLLPFQLDDNSYAVAAYVMSTDISRPITPIPITIEIDRKIAGDVKTIVPVTKATGTAKVAGSTVTFDLRDDVTWMVFDVE